MRICIPTETDQGEPAKVYPHLGSAPYFTIYDSDANIFDIVDNSNQHHAHGTCHPMAGLAQKNIDTVICSGMGARAVQKFNESGVKTYRATAGTVEQVIRQFAENALQKITLDDACREHACH